MYNLLISKLIPVPFVEGGRDLNGLDCWGLVVEGFKILNPSLHLPEINVHCGINSSNEVGDEITKEKQFFKKVDSSYSPSIIVIKHNDPIYSNHVGIYMGDGKFIHTRRKIGVSVDSIESPAWRRKIEGYYVPEEVISG